VCVCVCVCRNHLIAGAVAAAAVCQAERRRGIVWWWYGGAADIDDRGPRARRHSGEKTGATPTIFCRVIESHTTRLTGFTGRDSVARIRYDTRCCFNVRSKADTSQLNLPHGTDN